MLLVCATAWCQTSTDAVRQLAAKILAQATPHSTVSISFENRSSLETGEAGILKAVLDEQLRAGGLELGESETKLRITSSEDAAHYLLIAQLGNEAAIITSWTKPPHAATEYRMSIKRTPVWEQREPILDVKLSDGGSTMLVLEPARIVEYVKKDTAWQMDHATNNPPGVAASRDPRGQIGADPTMHWAAGRNYLDGGDRGYFYTKAETGAGTLLAGVDGRTRLFAQRPEPLAVINNWGSGIVAIESNCGAKQQVLATAPVTDDSQDQLQAFEFSGSTYAPVSEPLSLPGPITALWPSEAEDQVTVVVRNSQTGMYEASRVSLYCRQ